MHGRETDRPPNLDPAHRGQPPTGRRVRKRLARLVLVNLMALAVLSLVAEAGFRWFDTRYWVRCDRWIIGSGRTQAGKKWWPETTYQIESQEFRTRFRTNALGYRARPEPPKTDRPYRIAFVGDSFTEGMQVDAGRTFCARIEGGLSGLSPGREVVCENFGVADTGLFDYWHRITHDVLRTEPPEALVLCLYPGNDFLAEFPDDGFKSDGQPRRDYFPDPSWLRHALAWVNLQSKFGSYLTRSVFIASRRLAPPPLQAPLFWWADPQVAARVSDAPAVRRSKALLEAIAAECRQRGTRLCILVVGPVDTYDAWKGQSPLARILADWGIDAPVIDVAVAARSRPDWWGLVFPQDGHLNEAGHAFVAAMATPPLRAALAPSDRVGTLR